MFLIQLLSTTQEWVAKMKDAVDEIIGPLLIVGCSVGMIYAIVVGIKMMKADDKSARDEAKAKITTIAVSIVAIAVLIGLFYALANWLGTPEGQQAADDGFGIVPDDNQTPNGAIGGKLLNTISLVRQCVRIIIFRF